MNPRKQKNANLLCGHRT